MKKIIKKILKLVAVVVIAGVIVFAGFAANEIFGNPVSKYLAEKNAIAFVEEKYPGLKFEVGDTIYGFKEVRYRTEIKLTDSEDISFTVSCHKNGKYSHDDYDWVALERFLNAATEEIKPSLIKEFGEKSEPEIELNNFMELKDKEMVTIDQPVDLDNYPFELDVDINVYTDEEDYSEIIADTIRRIDSAVDDRFTVANYIIDIYNADGTELTDYVSVPAEAAQFAY